ncbi:MAG TPA: hypothetical protein VJX30_14960 [Terriglobales bacterium]|nr:hypothetical protein [Terriglobales bacterium]
MNQLNALSNRVEYYAFEENSGLAVVLPMDHVNDLVRGKAEEAWKLKQQPPSEQNH